MSTHENINLINAVSELLNNWETLPGDCAGLLSEIQARLFHHEQTSHDLEILAYYLALRKIKTEEDVMSSYWDEKESWVREDFESIDNVEAGAIKDVNLVAGDIDTPDEIRERLMAIIACNQHKPVAGDMTKGGRMSEISRSSMLLSELHSYFHEIASRRINTRYGRICDSPKRTLARRDAYIEQRYGKQ